MTVAAPVSRRRCERIGCDQFLSVHARADARYCSSTCRRLASRQRAGVSGSERPRVLRWSDYASRGRVAAQRARIKYAKRGEGQGA